MGSREFNDDGYRDSAAFLMSNAAYVPFDTDDRGRIREACVDPRNTDQPMLTVDIQTPGGLPGRAVDRAVTSIAMGYKPDLTDTLVVEAMSTSDRIGGAHYDTCKFVVGLETVLSIVADPGAAEWQAIEQYALSYMVDEHVVANVQRAAAQLRDRVAEQGDQSGLIERVDEMHANVHNVPHMVTPNTAAFYIVNHAIAKGLDRQRLLRDEMFPCTAYHDSLGASIARVALIEADDPQRQYRTAAGLLRTVATRAAVAPDLPHLDVYTVEHGQTVAVIESNVE